MTPPYVPSREKGVDAPFSFAYIQSVNPTRIPRNSNRKEIPNGQEPQRGHRQDRRPG